MHALLRCRQARPLDDCQQGSTDDGARQCAESGDQVLAVALAMYVPLWYLFGGRVIFVLLRCLNESLGGRCSLAHIASGTFMYDTSNANVAINPLLFLYVFVALLLYLLQSNDTWCYYHRSSVDPAFVTYELVALRIYLAMICWRICVQVRGGQCTCQRARTSNSWRFQRVCARSERLSYVCMRVCA